MSASLSDAIRLGRSDAGDRLRLVPSIGVAVLRTDPIAATSTAVTGEVEAAPRTELVVTPRASALVTIASWLAGKADVGRAVGSDVRVIGFDDVHDAGLNRPSLSSVAVPARETGRRAAQLVLERVAGSTKPAVGEEFPTKLEPRETCGCPRPQLLA